MYTPRTPILYQWWIYTLLQLLRCILGSHTTQHVLLSIHIRHPSLLLLLLQTILCPHRTPYCTPYNTTYTSSSSCCPPTYNSLSHGVYASPAAEALPKRMASIGSPHRPGPIYGRRGRIEHATSNGDRDGDFSNHHSTHRVYKILGTCKSNLFQGPGVNVLEVVRNSTDRTA
jgi:hypothetical protein